MIIRLLKWAGIILVSLFTALILAIILWPEKAYQPFEVSEGFRAEALAFELPELPDGWTDHTLEAADGTLINWGETANRETAKASLIFVPGFKGSLMMKGEEFGLLEARGYHVVGIDLRGQGRSERHRPEQPEKLYAKDFAVYADDVRLVIEAAGLSEDKPVILMGMSFGAAVVTRAVGEYDMGVDALVPMVPAYRPLTTPYSHAQAHRIMSVLKLLGKDKDFTPGQTIWQPYTTDLTQPSVCASNPKRLYLTEALYIRHPEQRVGGATVNWLSGLMGNGELISSSEFAAKIDIPTLMIVASDDVFVDTEFAVSACENGFPKCTVSRIPDTGHCITMEHDPVLTRIYDETDALLEQIIAKP